MRQPPHTPIQVQKLQRRPRQREQKHQPLEKQIIIDGGVREWKVFRRGGLVETVMVMMVVVMVVGVG